MKLGINFKILWDNINEVGFDQRKARTCIHSGNAGDIIYSLPTVKELGAKHYIINLNSDPAVGGRGITFETAKALAPLLLVQPYIERVTIVKCNVFLEYLDPDQPMEGIDYILDRFRLQDVNKHHLAICHALAFGIHINLYEKWLHVDSEEESKDYIVVALTPRYRSLSREFWIETLSTLRNIVLLGTPKEYHCVTGIHGNFVTCKDFLEMAKIIKGAKLFIGNPSLPYAIAEGLKVKRLVELPQQPRNAYPIGENGYVVPNSVEETRIVIEQLVSTSKITMAPVAQNSYKARVEPSLKAVKEVQAVGKPLGKEKKLHEVHKNRQQRYLEDRASKETLTHMKSSHCDDPYREVYNQQLLTRGYQNPQYVSLSPDVSQEAKTPVKLIAFYLPQFYPIPENDQWWGKGFTEWTNVSRAFPQFVDHYQPHLPGELGFYDLRVPEVQERQVQLARMYGIYGFCFYYYWFSGKKLLFKPIQQFVSNCKIDFPFCICWVNENWTRAWDGLDREILIQQQYSPENDIAMIRDLEPLLKHPNYIRINDRPLIIIYRPGLLPDPLATQERWRNYCKQTGIGELFLAGTETCGKKSEVNIDPREIGFDAILEFPPNGPLLSKLHPINDSLRFVNENFTGVVFDYAEAVKIWTGRPLPPYRLFKTVFPSWDNTARRLERAVIFHRSSPELYKEWLLKACITTLQHPNPEEHIVFINAWNEWAEGNHLEPDRRYGYAYLQATRDALKELVDYVEKKGKKERVKKLKSSFYFPKVSIVILNYNSSEHTIECLESLYRNIKYEKFQVIVIDNGSKKEDLLKLKNWCSLQNVKTIFCDEQTFPSKNEAFTKEIVFIETKKNLGFAAGNNVGITYGLNCGADYIWLLNNDTIVAENALFELVNLAQTDSKIGLISPKIYCFNDFRKVQYDGERIVFEGIPDDKDDFPKATTLTTGCSLLIRSDVIREIGLFDEDFFLYFEDNDFTMRTLNAGWKVYYQPQSKIYHKGGSSIGRWLKTPLSVYYASRNLLLFTQKHYPKDMTAAFEQLKRDIFPLVKHDKSLVFAFTEGVVDFLKNKKRKTDLPFDDMNLGKGKQKSLQRKKTESADDLQEQRLSRLKMELLQNPNESNLLNQFFNTALGLYYKEVLKQKQRVANAEALCHEGEILYHRGKIEEAIANFKKALENDPNHAVAYNNLALIYWQKGDLRKSVECLYKAMQLNPEDKDVVWNCGQIMLELGKVKDAYEVYKCYLKRHPEEKEMKEMLHKIEEKLMQFKGNTSRVNPPELKS